MNKAIQCRTYAFLLLASVFMLTGFSKKSSDKKDALPFNQKMTAEQKTRAERALENALSLKCEVEKNQQTLCTGKKPGAVLSTELLMEHRSDFLGFVLSQIPEVEHTAAYGVAVHKIKYCTSNTCGRSVPVSGAAFIPLVETPVGEDDVSTTPLTSPLVLASYHHGTQGKKDAVPSNAEYIESLAIAAAITSGGVAAVAPDYIGLGDSQGIHPYLHAATEVSATIDLIKALKNSQAAMGIQLNTELVLGGYSQGGHVTMAVHRYLEQEDNLGMNLLASAPMAGPYDLSGSTTVEAFKNPSESTPYYAAYLVLGMRAAYGVYAELGRIVLPNWVDKLLEWFNVGDKTNDEFEEELPNTLEELFKPEIVANVKAGNATDEVFLLALQKNDVYDWAPIAPMRLFHGSGDRSVPFSNSVKARSRMHELGATHVELVDVGDLDHRDAARPALARALNWMFDIAVPNAPKRK